MTEKVGEIVRANWAILVTLAVIAAAWGVSTAQIASLAEGNKAIIAEQRETTKQVSEVKATLAAQQATAAATAEAVADLRSRVREVERR